MHEKNIIFKTILVVFEDTLPNVSVKIWDYPPRQMCWRTSRIVMVLIRNDLLDCLLTPFSEKSSCEIPLAIMLVFQKICVIHSHLISRLPDAYEMHYAISTQSILTDPLPNDRKSAGNFTVTSQSSSLD